MEPRIRRFLFIGITAVVALILVASVLLERTKGQNPDSQVLSIEESLEDFNSPQPGHYDDANNNTADATIRAYGYWSGQYVGISYDTSKLNYSKQTDEIIFDAVQGTGSIPSENKFTGWHVLFHAISEAQGKQPTHLIIVDTEDAAAITVHLTNDSHPLDKLGVTTLHVNKVTREILSASITVYKTDELYENGLLHKVVIHEIGHALGLGHATLDSSVMHPTISIDDVTVYDLNGCEFAAVRELYLNHKVSESVKCN